MALRKGKIVKIKPKFKIAAIKNLIKDNIGKIEEAVLQRLQRVGENFITNARDKGTYTDQTGNLRSSIGYVVLKNGEQYFRAGFRVVEGKKQVAIKTTKRKTKNIASTGVVGREIGRIILDEVVNKFPKGLVLIVVAGMDYAAAVESKGKDVLTGSGQIAVRELKEAMARLRKQAKKAA